MLGRGLKLLDDELGKISGDTLAGDVAFKLYDTYGFPLDLTQDALRERGLAVDTDGFDKAMEKQRAEARANWSGSGQAETEAVWFDLRNTHGATEFVGYQSPAAEGQVLAIVKDGAPVDSAKAGDEVALMLNQTPFYAESGGQVGDTGTISDDSGLAIEISDTQKRLGDVHVLLGKISAGSVALGALVHQQIDAPRRDAIRANHSATHLLHEALRRVLGDHVTQKGSLVNEHHLRFDFSHPRAMNDNEIDRVESLVNRIIRQNDEVATRLMTPDEAIEAGALALFGEKYGDEVRVLSMGLNAEGLDAEETESASDATSYSVELCGGTHVRRLGDIGLLKISQEGAVASGVRRIEARTGEGALAQIAAHEHVLHATTNELKVAVEDLPARVAKLVEERKSLDRELSEVKKQLALAGASGGAGAAEDMVREVNGISFMARCLDGLPAKQLRGLVDDGKSQIGSGVVVFIGIDGDKAGIAVGVTDDLTDKYDAVALVQAGSEAMGGKGGGGRADMAQAGGPDITAADAAIAAIEKRL
jgi:alanyl-tRNA synthetase